MDIEIRPIKHSDINRVIEIEREAFPTVWPPTPLNSELGNRVSRYLVACEPNAGEYHGVENTQLDEPPPSRDNTVIDRLLGFAKGRFPSLTSTSKSSCSIVGYVGLWFLPDEAHITAIAVEESSRGKGLGELLLIGCIETARQRKAKVVSLETRVTNFVAQALYQKYGFEKMGLRRAYYMDNREDALIMTTEPICGSVYSERFRHLRQKYERRYGQIRMSVA